MLDLSKLTDREAVMAVLGGNRNAFSVLVERYQGVVQGMLLSYATGEVGAEDLAQEAFLRAFRQLGTLRHPERFGPWLTQIARNLALDQVRKDGRQRPVLHLVEAVRDDVEQRDLHRLLREEVGNLAPKYREVIMLRYFSGRTVLETARLLNISRAAAEKRLQRSKVELGEKMAGHLDAAFEKSSKAERSIALTGVMAAVFLLPPPARAEGVLLGLGGTQALVAKGMMASGAFLLSLSGWWMLSADEESPIEPVAVAQVVEAPEGVAEAKEPALAEQPADILTEPTVEPAPLDEAGIEGRVVNTDGAPIADATVRAYAEDDLGPLAKSDADGLFRIEGLKRPEYLLRVNAVGYKLAKRGPVRRGVRGVEFVLEPSIGIYGRVVHKGSKNPIADVHVQLRDQGVYTDAMGQFSLGLPSGALLNIAQEEVEARKDGYVLASAWMPYCIDQGISSGQLDEACEVVVEMVKAPIIEGVVVTTEGKPVPNAMVYLGGPHNTAECMTGETGTFTIATPSRIASRLYVVPFQALIDFQEVMTALGPLGPAWATIPQWDTEAGATFPERVSLRIVLDTPASLGGRLVFTGVQPGSLGELESLQVGMGNFRPKLDEVDVDRKTFQFKLGRSGLPPGPGAVVITWNERVGMPAFGHSILTRSITRMVEIAGGTMTQAEVRIPSVLVQGQVLHDEGMPLYGDLRYSATGPGWQESGSTRFNAEQPFMLALPPNAMTTIEVSASTNPNGGSDFKRDVTINVPGSGEVWEEIVCTAEDAVQPRQPVMISAEELDRRRLESRPEQTQRPAGGLYVTRQRMETMQ